MLEKVSDMNWAHIHLILNHVPVIGMAFGILLLLVAVVRRSEELKRVSLGFFVVLAVLALPTYFTGEPAADLVQSLPGVSTQLIGQHQDAALVALIGVGILGLVALGGLIRYRQAVALPSWLMATAFVLALAVGGWLAWTANLGGQIRHSEIRAEAKAGTSRDRTNDLRVPAATPG